jgi:ATP-dependent DNA ligase
VASDPAGHELVQRLPELAGWLRVAARSVVLDSELVVVDALGRADTTPCANSQRAPGTVSPPVFLHLDGRWLLSLPLEQRRGQLRRVLRPGDEVVMVPAISGEGRALHAAVTAQGIAGVLARRRTSPYLPGVRSALWRSIAAGPAGDAGAAIEAGGAPAAAGTAPVLALFRRLPFDEEPPAGE